MPRLRMHYCLFVVLSVSCSLGAAERRYDLQRKVLDNGLMVISLEDRSCPIVAVQVWYHVGSKDEDPNRQGFAHMFEHMMFRGTDRLGPEAHFDYVRRTGGYVNGFTSFDNTAYVNQAPSNQLELLFWLEAERMAFLKIDEEGFHKERGVVEEERRMSSLNTPYGTVPEKVLAGIYTKHPYRWTPIGQIPHLRAATIDELQAFWDTYYTPSNAVLVVVGDVKHADVQALAEKYFGWIPKIPTPPRVTIKEPPQTEPRRLVIEEKKGPVPLVGVIYRGVPAGHADELPLDMLMSILGGGESSRMYRDLVKERKLAQVVMAMSQSLEDDGLAGAGAAILPIGSDKEKVLKALKEHIQRVRTEPVTDRELTKTKNQYLRNEVVKSLTVANKANLLGRYQTIEGDAEKLNRRLEDIRAVTADDLFRVAKTYLIETAETSGFVEPQSGAMLSMLFGGKSRKQEGDEATLAPKPATNRVAVRGEPRTHLKRPEGFPEKPPVASLLEVFPEIRHDDTVLDNGLRVVVVPNHKLPFVTMLLGVLNGSWTEVTPGAASMACQMITKGSKDHTAIQMAEELEFNAISLSAGASMDTVSVNASCVSDKFDLAVKLLAEVVRTPTFPQDEFNVLRSQTVMGLMVQSKTPEYLAERELRQRVFGEHPYARTPTGELEDVQRVKTDAVKAWWTSFVRPDMCVLYIAGDVEPAAAVAAARSYLGDWKAEGPKPEPTMPPIPEPASTRIWLVDRPGSVQSQIRIGHLGITRQDERYFASRVLSLIFGGGFNSRLNKAIRVEKGLTYGARGGIDAGRFAGTFLASTFTKTTSTAEAINVILHEIERIRTTLPDAEELDNARSYIIGSFAGQRETPQAMVNDLWLIEHCGLPKDYMTRLLDGVKRTSAEDVRNAARALMRKENLMIVVVGEAAKLKDELAKIAPVTVIGAPKADSQPVQTQKAAAAAVQ